ncbi:hypothetical protein AAE478_006476 [Parahypoxylon ruwenzoriense]
MAFGSLARHPSIWIIALASFAAGIELGNDIKTLVPACAQPCLVSLIEGNYPSGDCASNPTLPCMCSEQSNSGYTIGEGALQCISAEMERGVCDEDVTGGSVKHDAYLMCSKVKNALPNTHSTLTATIVGSANEGAGSIILTSMPTVSAKMVSTSTVSGAVTLSSVVTSAVPTSGTPTPTPAPTETGSLGTGQIIAITVGVAGTITIALVAILIARRIRKRKYPDLEGGFTPMVENRSKPSPGPKRPGTLVISPPFRRLSNRTEPQVPPRHMTPVPRVHTPQNPRTPSNFGPSPRPRVSPNSNHEAVGLAISRSLSATPSASPEAPIQRPISRLLPAKPTLSLKVPPPRPPPLPEPSFQAPVAATRVSTSQTPQTDRASIFSNMTAFADLDTEAPEGGQIWRPPPSDPRSATTSYVADRWVGSVSGNGGRQPGLAQVTEIAELDTYTPMTKSPIEKEEEEAAAMAVAVSAASAVPKVPQPAFLSKDPSHRTLNRSSSVYSQASVRRNSRVSANGSRRSWRGNGVPPITRSDTKMSHDSVTTINTSSSSPFDEEPPFEIDNAHLPQLPTVMETPSPATGRSPVTYPKIPGRLNRAMLQVDPPPKPDFMASPPGQPSPTLKGAAAPIRDPGSPYPQPLKPRRSGRAQIPVSTSPSPDTKTALTPPPRRREHQPPIPSPMSRFSPRAPNADTPTLTPRAPERLRTAPMQTSGSGFSPNPPNVETFPAPSPLSSRSDRGEARPHVAREVSPLSLATMSTGAAAASSLLAKRIGGDKAAALALAPDSKKKNQWERQGGQGSIPSPEDGGLSSPKGTLPHTPTWQPKLTPTRHGDDLYLNVQ